MKFEAHACMQAMSFFLDILLCGYKTDRDIAQACVWLTYNSIIKYFSIFRVSKEQRMLKTPLCYHIGNIFFPLSRRCNRSGGKCHQSEGRSHCISHHPDHLPRGTPCKTSSLFQFWRQIYRFGISIIFSLSDNGHQNKQRGRISPEGTQTAIKT